MLNEFSAMVVIGRSPLDRLVAFYDFGIMGSIPFHSGTTQIGKECDMLVAQSLVRTVKNQSDQITTLPCSNSTYIAITTISTCKDIKILEEERP